MGTEYVFCVYFFSSKIAEFCKAFSKGRISISTGSVDSKRLPQKEFSASFQEGERKTLIDVCLNFINEIARKLN